MNATDLAILASEALNALNDLATLHRDDLSIQQVNAIEKIAQSLPPALKEKWFNNQYINPSDLFARNRKSNGLTHC